ncbi:MAG: hypothetical protein KKD39_00695 [Candidatus Altiarchaeota archaeon]|nr:hypothetical protein [Candidatus Altiarchaeota archaeon]
MAKRKRQVSTVKVGILLSGVLAIVLGILVFLSVISFTLAGIIILVMLLGMLVLHGGGTELATGLSDAEGYERQLEEEEQRKAEEAEYFGETPEEE